MLDFNKLNVENKNELLKDGGKNNEKQRYIT